MFRAVGASAADELRWFRERMPADLAFGLGRSNKGLPEGREREVLAASHASRR